MDNTYSQHDIAKICNERDMAISRILERSTIRPSVTLGLRLLFTEEQKDEVLRLVAEYRQLVPKVKRTRKAS